MATPPTTSLQPGMTGSQVQQLQQWLVENGLMSQTDMNTGPGIYGPKTVAAVTKFQQAVGVDNSSGPGYWGPKTISAYQTKISSSSSPQKAPPPVNMGNFTVTGQPATTTNNYNYQQSTTTSAVPPVIPPSPQPLGPNGETKVSSSNQGASNPYGLTTKQVEDLQHQLVKDGYMTQPQMDTGPGIFGPQTTAAFTKWQKANSPLIDPGTSKGDVSGKTVTLPNGQVVNIDSNGNIVGGAAIPDGIPELPSSMQKMAVYNLPEEAFQSLVPTLKPGTPEYQSAMDALDTSYFDIMQQQMNAQTEQEQQVADYNWQVLKKTLESNFNVALSNNAFQAWDQVQNIKKQFGQGNIGGSGLETEAIDSYLRRIRQTDAVTRAGNQDKADSEEMTYLKKFGTPDQIKAFIASDPGKAKAWGLIPSDEIRAAMTPAALKAKYPTMSDQEIQANIASIMDTNGNYWSNINQRKMTGSNVGINMGNTGNALKDQYGNVIAQTINPSDSGILDINQAKTQYQDINTPLANQLADYNAKVKLGSIKPTSGAESGTSSGTQFNQITPNAGVGTPPSSNPPVTLNNSIVVPGSMTSTGTSGTQAAAAAASNLGTSSPSTVAPPAQTPSYTWKKDPVTGSVSRTDPATGQSTTGSLSYMKSLGYTGT